MLFRNVALISLALVAAASAADTSPTSNHVSSLLSQRRLPKEELPKDEGAAKANSKQKDNMKNEKKDDKKADNKNVVIPKENLEITRFEGLNTLGYGGFTLNGSMGGTNVSGTPTAGQTLIDPNRESEDGAGDDAGMGGGMGVGVGAGEASSEGPACNLGTVVEVALGDMANFSSLVAALQAANFVEILKGDGPFTVFGK